MQKVKIFGNQWFWGISTLVAALVIALVVSILYINPPDQKLISFYTDDAATLRPGDTVRIAGIIVGEVKDLSIEPDQVRVRASVRRDAFIGDRSQVQVRMLTIVGGYYVTVIPAGRTPLGNRAIPKDRVTMPYSLMQTLVDSTKITDRVDSRPIRETLDQVQQGLTGANTQSLSALLHAGNAVVDSLDRQRGDLTKILDLSDEYLDKMAQYDGQLTYYIKKVAILEQILTLYGKEFAASMDGIGTIGAALMPVTNFYFSHRMDFLNRVNHLLTESRTIAGRTGLVVRVLNRIHNRMEVALDKQNQFTRPELLATDICIPIHGSPC